MCESENLNCEMAAIFSGGKWVKPGVTSEQHTSWYGMPIDHDNSAIFLIYPMNVSFE